MEMDDYMEDMEFKNKQKITTTISTHNNVDYLKLAVKSVRQNAYYKDMPLIVHAENCSDGTDEWLEENKNNMIWKYT